METLRAAVLAGADSVYFGGSNFNARRNAVNFDDSDIVRAIDFCHKYGVKSYIALNTLLSDRELESVAPFIKLINDEGADGVIVQDLGVAAVVRQIAPKLPLHASTQATVFDIAGVNAMQALGFTRIVLARELSKQQILSICEHTELEIEVFVHGAHCVSYSGQCLMSSVIGGRSGNRGECAGPCRLPYSIEGRNGYFLNMKDLCLLNRVNELTEIGVTSLKIEGRMKGVDYVKAVVGAYRRVIDTGIPPAKEDFDNLNRVFYRGGLTDAYFCGKPGSVMFNLSNDNKPYSLQPNSTNVNPNHKEVDRRVKLNLESSTFEGIPLKLEARDEFGNTATFFSDTELTAAESAKVIDRQRISAQLTKLGETHFTSDSINVNTDDKCFLPVSVINNARREICRQITEQQISRYKRVSTENATASFSRSSNRPRQFRGYTVSVETLEQLQALNGFDVASVYIPFEIAVKHNYFTQNCVVSFPPITTDFSDLIADNSALLKSKGITKVLAANIGQIKPLIDLGFEVYLDHSLNIYNSISLLEYAKMGVNRICISTEASLPQIRGLRTEMPIEAVVYGRLPVMYTRNCIMRNAGCCKKEKKQDNVCKNVITDRMNAKFPIKSIAMSDCANVIYNSRPIMMSDRITQLKSSNIDYLRLAFTVEDKHECIEVINSYYKNIAIKTDFTRGAF